MAAYGSLNNLLESQTASKTPEVGMGATMLFWTDRKPATIVAVSKSGKRVTIQEDTATRVDTNGMSESQDYTFEPDPEGATYDYSLRKDGSWKMVNGDSQIRIGSREKYYDYSF